jgi:type IV pilus assembly protein PilC
MSKKTTTTTLFTWVGINHRGVKVRGERQARNVSILRILLRQEGVNATSIRKKPQPFFKTKITSLEIAQFSRQLTIMLEAGIPVVQALDLMAKGHENNSVQRLIISIKTDVERGHRLAKVLQKHPQYFNELFINLVAAGEKAGTLEHMLSELADYQERTQATKAKVKYAMLYPLFVIVISGVIFSLMLIFVIPQFEQVFSNFDAQLPAFTLWLMALSKWLQNTWWQVILLLGSLVYIFVWARQRFIVFYTFVDRFMLKLPLIGKIIRLSAISRFARTLSTMFAAGVPIVEAMDSVAGSTGNSVYKYTTLRIKEDISQGVQLFTAMQTQQMFPNMVIQMTKIGEESGRLEEMLIRVADYYDEQVANLTASLVKQIEPLIMLIIGLLVGALVIGMYLPIFKLGDAI